MAKKVRYKKPRLSTESTQPVFWMDRKAIKTLNTVKNDIPRRLARGRELFILKMAEILRGEVQKKAPEIKLGSEDVDYSESLKIAILDGVDDAEAVAVYFETSTAKLTVKRLEETVLFF